MPLEIKVIVGPERWKIGSYLEVKEEMEFPKGY